MTTTLSIGQLPFILAGTFWTIVLSLLGFVGGALVGLPIALARTSRLRAVRWAAGAYVGLVQGIPLPVLMFIFYFGLSVWGGDAPAIVAAGLAMAVYSSAFLGEIWRGCIQAVPRTQWEAAESLALGPVQRLVDVILPQAIRIATPPTVGFMVQIVKNTSYAVVIGFFDLTYSARVINNSTFSPFTVFTLAGLIYFALCYPLSNASRRLERRLSSRAVPSAAGDRH